VTVQDSPSNNNRSSWFPLKFKNEIPQLPRLSLTMSENTSCKMPVNRLVLSYTKTEHVTAIIITIIIIMLSEYAISILRFKEASKWIEC